MKGYNELGITVRYLAYPRQGPTVDVADTMAAIWCADDPVKAMSEAKDDQAQVRIFGTVISTYTRIVEITAREVGLSHETIATPARSAQNRHPFSKVPVVEVDRSGRASCRERV